MFRHRSLGRQCAGCCDKLAGFSQILWTVSKSSLLSATFKKRVDVLGASSLRHEIGSDWPDNSFPR